MGNTKLLHTHEKHNHYEDISVLKYKEPEAIFCAGKIFRGKIKIKILGNETVLAALKILRMICIKARMFYQHISIQTNYTHLLIHLGFWLLNSPRVVRTFPLV